MAERPGYCIPFLGLVLGSFWVHILARRPTILNEIFRGLTN